MLQNILYSIFYLFLLFFILLSDTFVYCMNPNKEHRHVLIESGSINNAGENYNGQSTAYPSVMAHFLVSDMCQSKALRARNEYDPKQISILDFATSSCTNYQAPIESTKQNPISAIDFLGNDSFIVGHNNVIYTLSYSGVPDKGQLKKLSECVYPMTNGDTFFAIKQTNEFLVVVTQKGHICLYPKKEQTINIENQQHYLCPEDYCALSIDTSNNVLCFGLNNGRIYLFDIAHKTGQIIRLFSDSSSPVNSLSCMNGKILAGSLCDCCSHINDGEVSNNIKEHQCANKYAIFLPNVRLTETNTPKISFLLGATNLPREYHPQEMLLLASGNFVLRTYCMLLNNDRKVQEKVLLVDPGKTISNSQILYDEKRSISEVIFSEENPLRMRITAENDHVIIFREQNFSCSTIDLRSKYQIFIPSDQLTYRQKVTLFLQKHPNIAFFLDLAEITLFLTAITVSIRTLLLLLKNRLR